MIFLEKLLFLLQQMEEVEKVKLITNSYYKGSKGAFVVYDLSRKTSFNNIDKWFDLKNNGDENINIVLIGNKIDLEN